MVGKVQIFQIEAAKDWQPTIAVKKGQKISIEADGEWSPGPKTTCGAQGGEWRGRPAFFLEGRVGDSSFKIGDTWDGSAPADGVLEMRMWDPGRADNSGEISVTVSH